MVLIHSEAISFLEECVFNVKRWTIKEPLDIDFFIEKLIVKSQAVE